MKRHIVVALTLALALILVAGCSDDDECPTCPPVAVQNYILYGYTGLDQNGTELDLYTYIFGVDGSVPVVDSIKIADGLCELRTMYDAVSICAGRYEGPAGTLSSGDNVTVTAYTPSGVGSATVALLDDDADTPIGFNHPVESPYDTVAIGEAITVSWSPVANADWYGVYYGYSYDSSGVHDNWNEWSAQTTTSISIPVSQVLYNGYFRFNITPMTGPRPDQTGNVSGGTMRGTVNSSSYEYLRIYVGTGDAYPSSPEPPDVEPDVLEMLKAMHGF